MKKSIQLVLSISFVTALFITSCKKKETAEVDNETQSAYDNSVADQEFSGIVPTVFNHASNTKGTGALLGKMMLPCDSLTKIAGDTLWGVPGHISDAEYKLALNAGCSASFTDGKSRTGEWKIRLTGKIKNAGSKMIIKLNEHLAAGKKYACDSIVVTTITITPTFTKFRVQLINGLCSTANWKIKYNSDRTVTHYYKGNPSGTDPYTEVYGTANGVNRLGRKFDVNISEATPLVKYKACEFIQKGILTLTPEGYKERSIDFGYSIAPKPAGGCDEDASFSVNGNTIAFKLK
jgi:hypothetical protein